MNPCLLFFQNLKQSLRTLRILNSPIKHPMVAFIHRKPLVDNLQGSIHIKRFAGEDIHTEITGFRKGVDTNVAFSNDHYPGNIPTVVSVTHD